MNDRLEKALEFANYRQTLNTQLNKSKIKTDGLLILAKNGGTFYVSQDLICFLDYLNREGRTRAIIFDRNKLPVEILDIPGFLKEVTTRYFEVSNDFLREYQLIRKARNVKSILEIE
ncbi:MAG: hypothetical protein ACHQ1D_01755 [Nitrososphaerales archaeon]